jgi:hypothetical protein
VLFEGSGLVGECLPIFGFLSIEWIFGVLMQCMMALFGILSKAVFG